MSELPVAIAHVLPMLPAIVELGRSARNIGSMVVINALLLGWTLAGWVVARAMAAAEKEKARGLCTGLLRPRAVCPRSELGGALQAKLGRLGRAEDGV